MIEYLIVMKRERKLNLFVLLIELVVVVIWELEQALDHQPEFRLQNYVQNSKVKNYMGHATLFVWLHVRFAWILERDNKKINAGKLEYFYLEVPEEAEEQEHPLFQN